MDLHTLWFVLIAILFTGFFVLEGFDYGVGILLPWLGKKGHERDMIIHTIAPFWDGNEVWLIAGAGAIFAAFPIWYATMFSSFYLEIFFVLFALILRGAAIEFRGQRETARWRTTWDWLIFIGSVLPGFLWGMILSNMITGLPVDAHQNYAGTVLTPFNAQAILFGLAFVALFTLHGALFLNLRIELGELTQRAHKTALFCWLPVVVLFAATYGMGYAHSELMRHIMTAANVLPINVLLLTVMLLVLGFLLSGHTGWAFTMSTLIIILGALEIGFGAFPNVMLSSQSNAWTLTAYNASSSPYTLTVMSWIALSIVPIMLVYQAWNYYIFRHRVQPHAAGYH
jgi:cytochrome bd ubiquinol oxidase subunit II